MDVYLKSNETPPLLPLDLPKRANPLAGITTPSIVSFMNERCVLSSQPSRSIAASVGL